MPRPATVSSEQLTDALMRLVVDRRARGRQRPHGGARRPGVSVGAVQYHFKTKDDLLLRRLRARDRPGRAAGAGDRRDERRSDFVARGCCASCCRSTRAARPSCGWRWPSARARSHSERLAALYTHRLRRAHRRGGGRARAGRTRRSTRAARRSRRSRWPTAWRGSCSARPPRLSADAALAALDAHLARLWPPDYPPAQWLTASPSPRSRRIRSRMRTRSGRSPPRSRGSSPSAGTACCCSRRRGRPSSCASRAS